MFMHMLQFTAGRRRTESSCVHSLRAAEGCAFVDRSIRNEKVWRRDYEEKIVKPFISSGMCIFYGSMRFRKRF